MLSDRELLLKIHQMLVKVCNYIDKVESPEYQKKIWERDFNNNMLADLATERLEQIRNEILDRKY